MSVKLLTEHHLEFLSLKGGCTCSPESTLVKMPHCWKSHVAAQIALSTSSMVIKGFVQNAIRPTSHVLALLFSCNSRICYHNLLIS